MKRLLFLSVLVLGVLVGISPAVFAASPYSGGSSAISAAPVPTTNCSKRLDNNFYACNVKSSFGSEFPDILFFNESPFSLSAANLGFTLACTCDATGNFTNPKFNASPGKWVCVGDDGFGFSITFKGQVLATGKINSVMATTNLGDQFVLDCAGP